MRVYAVVKTGGKQYKVAVGHTIRVDRLAADEGATVELDEVLMLADGTETTVGTPTVAGAKVVARVVEQGRGPKIIVFKYKPKVRYRRKQGHRQLLTTLTISDIVGPNGQPNARSKPAAVTAAPSDEASEAASADQAATSEE